MTNFEYYKEQILETVNKHRTNFAVVDGKPISCAVTPCPDCQIKGGICAVERIKWLYEEHIEQPKLTKKERTFLEICKPECYIARDKWGDIYLFEVKPAYNRSVNTWSSSRSYINLTYYNNIMFNMNNSDEIFHFIKWEDEPWSVEELLKLEVEE
jgi:hypothetical protein